MYDTGDSWHFFIRKGDIVMDKRDYKVNIRLNLQYSAGRCEDFASDGVTVSA